MRGNLLSAFVGGISFGINLIAWNFWFPSTFERNMWRASAITSLACALYAWIYQFILITFFPKLKERACRQSASVRDELGSKTSPQFKDSIKERIITKWKNMANRLRNNSPNKEPALTVPIRVILPSLFVSTLYLIARCYLLTEDLIAFRALPPHAYKTVSWSQLFFHI
jgi:hypothetical protein